MAGGTTVTISVFVKETTVKSVVLIATLGALLPKFVPWTVSVPAAGFGVTLTTIGTIGTSVAVAVVAVGKMDISTEAIIVARRAVIRILLNGIASSQPHPTDVAPHGAFIAYRL
jgi:hypothetical protein